MSQVSRWILLLLLVVAVGVFAKRTLDGDDAPAATGAIQLREAEGSNATTRRHDVTGGAAAVAGEAQGRQTVGTAVENGGTGAPETKMEMSGGVPAVREPVERPRSVDTAWDEGDEKALERIRETPVDPEANERAEPIFFSTLQPVGGDAAPGPLSDSFAPDTTRIYAVFETVAERLQGRERVLVKWHNRDVLFCEYVPISPTERFNYAWLDPGSWSPGNHNVEIYDPDDQSLIASGSFLIQDQAEYYAFLLSPAPAAVASSEFFPLGTPVYLGIRYSLPAPRALTVSVFEIGSPKAVLRRNVPLGAGAQLRAWLPLASAGGGLKAGEYQVVVDADGSLVGRLLFRVWG